MKVTYDPAADALHIRFREVPVDDTEEDENGFILDYDQEGKVIGIEILAASSIVDNPLALSYETLGNVTEHHITERKTSDQKVYA